VELAYYLLGRIDAASEMLLSGGVAEATVWIDTVRLIRNKFIAVV
jgi:hypothetical protein